MTEKTGDTGDTGDMTLILTNMAERERDLLPVTHIEIRTLLKNKLKFAPYRTSPKTIELYVEGTLTPISSHQGR